MTFGTTATLPPQNGYVWMTPCNISNMRHQPVTRRVSVGNTWSCPNSSGIHITLVADPYECIAPFSYPQYYHALSFIACGLLSGHWGRSLLNPCCPLVHLRQKYLEPRLLIVTDPRTDSQAIKEVWCCEAMHPLHVEGRSQNPWRSKVPTIVLLSIYQLILCGQKPAVDCHDIWWLVMIGWYEDYQNNHCFVYNILMQHAYDMLSYRYVANLPTLSYKSLFLEAVVVASAGSVSSCIPTGPQYATAKLARCLNEKDAGMPGWRQRAECNRSNVLRSLPEH